MLSLTDRVNAKNHLELVVRLAMFSYDLSYFVEQYPYNLQKVQTKALLVIYNVSATFPPPPMLQ